MWVAAWVMRIAIKVIGLTTRMKIIEGQEVLDKLIKEKRQVIYCFWHNRIFFMGYFLKNHMRSKGGPNITIIVSESKDAEFIARVVHLWKGGLARGSATRGGSKAMLGLVRALRKSPNAVALTPDGPKGPKYGFKVGALALTQMVKAPIVPVCCYAKKSHVFNSWDNFEIPKLFSRINVSIGEPIDVPPKLTQDGYEIWQKKIEKIMVEQVKYLESSL